MPRLAFAVKAGIGYPIGAYIALSTIALIPFFAGSMLWSRVLASVFDLTQNERAWVLIAHIAIGMFGLSLLSEA